MGYTSSGSSRRRSSPSGSTSRDHHRVAKSQVSSNGHNNWFKSLDRLAHRKKSKKEDPILTSGTESDHPSPSKKNLRFFGDTDLESNDSIRHRGVPQRSKLNGLRGRSQSTKELHNISEEIRGTDMLRRREGHRPREMSRERDRARRRKNEVSSVESSTEGDSSQQSQRSIVYLHAATVGDIPGPANLRNGRRAASREELASNSSSRIQPQVKTLSRSFSVLAPWRPRHPKEAMDIDYAQQPRKNGKYEQKVTRNGGRKDSSSTLKKKAQESRKNQSSSTLNRRSRSKENLGSQTLRRSKEELTRGSNSTLYKKKERMPRENSRYNSRDEKKMSSKSLSVESLGGGRRSKSSTDSRDISRSVSMPRDPEKSAGWFKMSKKKHSGSTQRL
ncbi:unnamed protein product [Acanthoscelides obtectus]|uniref:Uncharacterized protein n=1 Tax=Acanthoscelides obtectus TaxID=200917 RepID=A0A9P0KPI0_ACAOB|nr:unnamed protein product [Acanthoscelides obtectus]CAK1657706.1 hypothetical protein AOBTE_LOCUS20496 [Acanthoscelides obtectus]